MQLAAVIKISRGLGWVGFKVGRNYDLIFLKHPQSLDFFFFPFILEECVC